MTDDVRKDADELEQIVFVYVTAPTQEVAYDIARAVVEERLAACVNIVPNMTSVYRWNGVIQSDSEVVLICKTNPDRVDEMEARLKALHPYDCPCIVVLPVVGGSAQFISWVSEEAKR